MFSNLSLRIYRKIINFLTIKRYVSDFQREKAKIKINNKWTIGGLGMDNENCFLTFYLKVSHSEDWFLDSSD